MTTVGKGLNCTDVYLSVNGKKASRNEFVYGEKDLTLRGLILHKTLQGIT